MPLDSEAIKLLWIGTLLAAGVGAVITLIAAADNINKWSICALVILGASCFSVSWYALGWAKSPVRVVTIYGATWFLMALLGAAVWPTSKGASEGKPVSDGGSQPNLQLAIDEMAIGWTQDGASTALTVIASLRNLGTPSIAQGWRLQIILPDGDQMLLTPQMLDKTQDIKIHDDNGRLTATIPMADALYDKAIEKPIEPGSLVRGVLVFIARHIPVPSVRQQGTKFTLICNDVANKQVTGSYVWRGSGPGVHSYYPGMIPPPSH